MTVAVIGYRHLVEPPELGDCEDPDCRTFATKNLPGSAWEVLRLEGERGRGVLIVASYADSANSSPVRVCAPCDERRLRAWLEDES